MSWNQWTGFGNLTRDPEVRYTPQGLAVCEFNVACNRKFKGKDGNYQDEVTFVGVVAFGKSGETIAQCFRKGQQIFISGRLKNDSWEDKKTGQKRTKTRVVCEQWSFVGPRPSNQAPQQEAVPVTTQGAAQPQEEDDVPF